MKYGFFYIKANKSDTATPIISVLPRTALTTVVEMESCDRFCSPQILKYFLPGPRQKMFAKPCYRTAASCSRNSFYYSQAGFVGTLLSVSDKTQLKYSLSKQEDLL